MTEISPVEDEPGSKKCPPLSKGLNFTYEGLPQKQAALLYEKLRQISPDFLQAHHRKHRGGAAHKRIDDQACATAAEVIDMVSGLGKFPGIQFFCCLQAYRVLSKPAQQAAFYEKRKGVISCCLGLLEQSLGQEDPDFARWNFLTLEDTILERDLNGSTDRFKLLRRQVRALERAGARFPRTIPAPGRN